MVLEHQFVFELFELEDTTGNPHKLMYSCSFIITFMKCLFTETFNISILYFYTKVDRKKHKSTVNRCVLGQNLWLYENVQLMHVSFVQGCCRRMLALIYK